MIAYATVVMRGEAGLTWGHMRVYLFRDHHSNAFAYSVDVTGRNIPPQTAETKWGYETVTSDRELAPQAV
jgi:hypothetical protein